MERNPRSFYKIKRVIYYNLFMENITNPGVRKFFILSKISFSGAVLEAVCNSRSKVCWDFGLFLVSILNIFLSIIEATFRFFIFAGTYVVHLCEKTKETDKNQNHAFYCFMYTLTTLYFSLKFVPFSLFNKEMDLNRLCYGDAVQAYMTKASYYNERIRRTH